jgi:hypothetical protein
LQRSDEDVTDEKVNEASNHGDFLRMAAAKQRYDFAASLSLRTQRSNPVPGTFHGRTVASP